MQLSIDLLNDRVESREQMPANFILVSGPSGAGKGAIIERGLAAVNDCLPAAEQLQWSVSWTTRAPREGEVADRDYHFVSRDEFEAKIADAGFLEFSEHMGNYYGTIMPDSENRMLYEMEVDGARQVVKSVTTPGQLLFILPPSVEELWQRLMRRQDQQSMAKKIGRLERFAYEVGEAARLPYHFIVNDNLDLATAEFIAAVNGTFFCRFSRAEVEALVADYSLEATRLAQKLHATVDQV